jgi:hypothetical protein
MRVVAQYGSFPIFGPAAHVFSFVKNKYARVGSERIHTYWLLTISGLHVKNYEQSVVGSKYSQTNDAAEQ